MSYAKAAEAAEAYAATLRAVGADGQLLRIGDAFAGLARALDGLKSKAAAQKAIDAAVGGGSSSRLSRTSMGDVALAAESAAALAECFEAKAAVVHALRAIAEITDAHAPLDAGAIIAALEDQKARDALASAEKVEKKREKEKADRRLGALYAERLTSASQDREALGPIIAEMKARKPALPPEAWKEIANQWVGVDPQRTGKTAKKAVEQRLRAIATADHAFARGRAAARA